MFNFVKFEVAKAQFYGPALWLSPADGSKYIKLSLKLLLPRLNRAPKFPSHTLVSLGELL